MSSTQQIPMPLGETLADGTLDELLGLEAEFTDYDYDSNDNVRPLKTQRRVKAVLVKNDSGGLITPSELVTYKASGTGVEIGGETATTGVASGVSDPFLPAAGVADQEKFWMIVDGPAKIKNDGTGAITSGDLVKTSTTVTGRIEGGAVTDGLVKVGRAMEDAAASAGALFRCDVHLGH